MVNWKKMYNITNPRFGENRIKAADSVRRLSSCYSHHRIVPLLRVGIGCFAIRIHYNELATAVGYGPAVIDAVTQHRPILCPACTVSGDRPIAGRIYREELTLTVDYLADVIRLCLRCWHWRKKQAL